MRSIRTALDTCKTEAERRQVLCSIGLNASLSDDDLGALAAAYIAHGPNPRLQNKWARTEELGRIDDDLAAEGYYLRVRRLLANHPARALLAVLRQPEVKWRALPTSHRQRSLERLLTRQLPEMVLLAVCTDAQRVPDTDPEPDLHRPTKKRRIFIVHDAIHVTETMLEDGAWST